MEIPIDPRYTTALRYIHAVDEGGGHLTDQNIDNYIECSAPSDQALYMRSTLAQFEALFRAAASGNQHASYMRTVGWINSRSVGPRLTNIGRAIVTAIEKGGSSRSSDPEGVVLLSPDDPLNLGVLTREVAAAKDGLLVDAYFSDELVSWLWQSTSITRVLMCRSDEKCTDLRLYLGGLERAGRQIEFRVLPRGELHDRYLIGADGKVSMIGASLNGLHRNFTAIIEVSDPGASAIRDYVNAKWNSAKRVEPQQDIRQPLAESETSEASE